MVTEDRKVNGIQNSAEKNHWLVKVKTVRVRELLKKDPRLRLYVNTKIVYSAEIASMQGFNIHTKWQCPPGIKARRPF